jgi:hypothetical protein
VSLAAPHDFRVVRSERIRNLASLLGQSVVGVRNMLQLHHAANVASIASLRRGTAPHPIDAATSAMAAAVANAHERGDADSLRILHAVLALLSAAPKRCRHDGEPPGA